MTPRSMQEPHYPEISVRLHSRHPLAAVSAIRQALRRSGVAADEIRRFSATALAGDESPEEVCAIWARIDRPQNS